MFCHLSCVWNVFRMHFGKLLYWLNVYVFILVHLRRLCHLCLCHLLQPETRSTTIMISKAVKSMLKEVDSNGSLIPVSSLNDSSGKLNLLSLIVKTRPRCGCFWQEPKYQSRGFSLSDVLKPGEPEDKPLNPGKHQNSSSGRVARFRKKFPERWLLKTHPKSLITSPTFISYSKRGVATFIQ